ncbi:MAG: hypothetical protein R2711_06305 [Acidimicrobiales bacterium]
MSGGLRIGIAHHLGWAVAVTADVDHQVVDRRRIELVEPGLPAAPVHHEGGTHELHRTGPELDDDQLEALVAEVRASVQRATGHALDQLVADVGAAIASLSVAAWAPLPDDIASLRRPPYEAKADSVMYRAILEAGALERGWDARRFDARTVEADAARRLGDRAHEVLHGPRARLGAPWAKDHRTALAATVLAAGDPG